LNKKVVFFVSFLSHSRARAESSVERQLSLSLARSLSQFFNSRLSLYRNSLSRLMCVFAGIGQGEGEEGGWCFFLKIQVGDDDSFFIFFVFSLSLFCENGATDRLFVLFVSGQKTHGDIGKCGGSFVVLVMVVVFLVLFFSFCSLSLPMIFFNLLLSLLSFKGPSTPARREPPLLRPRRRSEGPRRNPSPGTPRAASRKPSARDQL